MKKISLLLVCFTAMLGLNSIAQESASAKGLSLTVSANGAIPLGSFKDQSGLQFGLGGSAQLGIPVSSSVDLTASAGYIGFSTSKTNELYYGKSFTMIPFYGGVRVHTPFGLYVHPKAGVTSTKYQALQGSTEFSYGLHVGYLINKKFDISAGYEALTEGKDQVIQVQNQNFTVPGVSAKFIGIRLGYNFNFARVK